MGSSAVDIAKESLSLNPKQGEPYFWWAFAILRSISSANMISPGQEVVNNSWQIEHVEAIADKIKVKIMAKNIFKP